MSVPARVVAATEQFSVLFDGEGRRMQPVRRMKDLAQAEKIFRALPVFSEEIIALMQSHSLERQRVPNLLEDVVGQALRRHRPVLQSRDLVVEVLMIELRPQGAEHLRDSRSRREISPLRRCGKSRARDSCGRDQTAPRPRRTSAHSQHSLGEATSSAVQRRIRTSNSLRKARSRKPSRCVQPFPGDDKPPAAPGNRGRAARPHGKVGAPHFPPSARRQRKPDCLR